jgi:two-component system phosphate regulon sensor histidine kinase PhoR
MQRRIRWRIVIPYIILLSIMVAVFSALAVRQLREDEKIRQGERLLTTAQLIASDLNTDFENEGERERFNRIAQNKSEISGLQVTILDPFGIVLGASSPIDSQDEANYILPILADVQSTGSSVIIDDHWIAAASAVRGTGGELLGYVHLHDLVSSGNNVFSGTIFWHSLGMVAASVVGMILLAWIIQDLSIKPIEKLTIAAQQMALGDFYNLDFPKAPEELTDLNLALQKMAQQLGSQIDALTSERAKLSAVLDQMADGVLIVDPNGRVQLLNPAAERIFQITESKALDRSVVEVLRYHQLVDLWRKTKVGKRQTTMLEIGPQHIFLQVVGIPLKSTLPGSTLLIFQDLTQLRRLETVRRDFISNVSHELRTPLASLNALAETLQEGALDDPPAARRFLLRMETEIDNMTQLVNELLELSRIESGKVPISFHRVLPYDLLKTAHIRMSLQSERAGLELTLDCEPNLPAVFADPDRIVQVLINLIHNATKFTAPGGKITLSAYQDNHRIVFFVRDTGVGIARKDLGRIFERFYKADQARTGGGTGLGLSIARHMVEVHDGYIWAESEPDMGSTFYFTLPTA